MRHMSPRSCNLPLIKLPPGRDGDNITRLDFVSRPEILSRFCECRDNRERDNEEKLALLKVMLKWISLRAKYIGMETFLHSDPNLHLLQSFVFSSVFQGFHGPVCAQIDDPDEERYYCQNIIIHFFYWL